MSSGSSRRDLIWGRLESVRNELNDVVARLTPEILEWAPTEGMRTVVGQLIEILEIEIPLVTFLKEGRMMSEGEYMAVMGKPETFEGLKEKLTEVRHLTLQYLGSLPESELLDEVDCKDIWFGSFWQPTLPRAEVFLNVASHELYHVGQLVSYMWARGDNPYEW